MQLYLTYIGSIISPGSRSAGRNGSSCLAVDCATVKSGVVILVQLLLSYFIILRKIMSVFVYKSRSYSITKTCLCNILRHFTAVKMVNFR